MARSCADRRWQRGLAARRAWPARAPAASPQSRRCPVRPRARSGCSRACTRGRSTRASRRGSAASADSDVHICCGVPSNRRPHPAANSVSPQNTRRHRRSRRRSSAMWPAVWPGMSSTRSVTGIPGTSTVVAFARARCVRPGIVSRAGPKTGTREARERAPECRRRGRRGGAWRGSRSARGPRGRDRRAPARRRRDRPPPRGAPSRSSPDVVVRESGDGDNRDHGRIFGTCRERVNDRSPTGSRRRSGATCSRASRRTSTRRSPTSSASTRCRSGCPTARSSRRAASRRAGRSTTTRPPTSSPTRTACRSPRTRSTSSCCRTRSSSPTTRTSCCARRTA